MVDFTKIFAAHLAAGATVEEGLAKLRAEGASPVAAIKAIRAGMRVSLSEAKSTFDTSPTWRQTALANSALHEEAIAVLTRSSES
jgi:ribosomal protein L7/L12